MFYCMIMCEENNVCVWYISCILAVSLLLFSVFMRESSYCF